MFSAGEQLLVPDDPVARLLGYLAAVWPELAGGVEPRPARHRGTHLQVTRAPAGGRRDWPLVESLLVCDVSHEDAQQAGQDVERLHSLVDAWPWEDPAIERDPLSDGASPAYNPLPERIPAYTISFKVKLIAGAPAPDYLSTTD